MKLFRWNHAKNEVLKANRQISFEEIVLAIQANGLVADLPHPNAARYPNQSILLVALADYVYLVPYVEEADCYFLKTVIPSRKAKREFFPRSAQDE